MSTLPDFLLPNLKIALCGASVSDELVARGHYYSKPSNFFWQLLHQAGFTPRQLRPDEDGSAVREAVASLVEAHEAGFSAAAAELSHVPA